MEVQSIVSSTQLPPEVTVTTSEVSHSECVTNNTAEVTQTSTFCSEETSTVQMKETRTEILTTVTVSSDENIETIQTSGVETKVFKSSESNGEANIHIVDTQMNASDFQELNKETDTDINIVEVSSIMSTDVDEQETDSHVIIKEPPEENDTDTQDNNECLNQAKHDQVVDNSHISGLDSIKEIIHENLERSSDIKDISEKQQTLDNDELNLNDDSGVIVEETAPVKDLVKTFENGLKGEHTVDSKNSPRKVGFEGVKDNNASTERSSNQEGRKVFGIHMAPVDIPLERRLQTLGLIAFIPGFIVLGVATLLVLFYLLLFTSYWWISVAYLTWWYADRNTPRNGGRRIEWVRCLKMWKGLSDFFPIKVVRTEMLDPSHNYIMACHPHGYLGIGIVSLMCTYGQRWKSLFPGIEINGVTLNSQFILPLYRELMLSLGVISADRESISAVLGPAQGGRAVCIVPGGAREALEAFPGAAKLYLRKRKGFCRLALKNGAHLVPVYSFGENDVYYINPREEGTILRRLQLFLLKILGIAVVAIQGRGVFQYSFGILPLRRKINIVVGSPIPVSQSEDPTEEEVDELHLKYMEELTKLYDNHKHEFATRPELPLTII